MPHRTPSNVRLGDLVHRDRRLHARGNAHALERVLQGERIDHGREHPHVVGGGAIHTRLFVHFAAPDVSAANHDGDGNTGATHVGDLIGHGARRIDVDAGIGSGERFAGDFEENAVVLGSIIR